jgi:hypothetical protein
LLGCKLTPTDFGLPSIVAHGLFYGVYTSQHTNAELVRIEALQLGALVLDREDAQLPTQRDLAALGLFDEASQLNDALLKQVWQRMVCLLDGSNRPGIVEAFHDIRFRSDWSSIIGNGRLQELKLRPSSGAISSVRLLVMRCQTP